MPRWTTAKATTTVVQLRLGRPPCASPFDTARGVYVIAPTPFHDDGRVDDTSIDRMTDFLRAAGCTGITVLGQMGEAPKLDAAEALAIAARVIRRAGVPVVVGVTAPGFAARRALTREVMDAGAAGVMIAPPNTLRTDEQIVGYYRNAAEAIGADVPEIPESNKSQALSWQLLLRSIGSHDTGFRWARLG